MIFISCIIPGFHALSLMSSNAFKGSCPLASLIPVNYHFIVDRMIAYPRAPAQDAFVVWISTPIPSPEPFPCRDPH